MISTGKTDWVREVTDASGTLAAYCSDVASGGGHRDKEKSKGKDKDKAKKASGSVAGVFDANPSKLKRVTILNGSHKTVSDDHSKETVLVFPDWKVLTEVERSPAGAEALYEHSVSPSVPLFAPPPSEKTGSLKSWLLPYACVILLCKSYLPVCLSAFDPEDRPNAISAYRLPQAARQSLRDIRAKAGALYVPGQIGRAHV